MSASDVFDNEAGSEDRILDAAIDEALALDEVTQAMRRAQFTSHQMRDQLSRMRRDLMSAARLELEEYSALYARRLFIAVTIRGYVDPVWLQLHHVPKRRFDVITKVLAPFWGNLIFKVPDIVEPTYRPEHLAALRDELRPFDDDEGEQAGTEEHPSPKAASSRTWRRRRYWIRKRLVWPVAITYWLILLGVFVAPPALFFAGMTPLWSTLPGAALFVPSAVFLVGGLSIRLARYKPAPKSDILERSAAIQGNLQNVVREDPDYREVNRQLAELARTIQRKLLEQSVLPLIRTLLNNTLRAKNLGAADPREFLVSSAPGLGEVEDDRFQINTATMAKLTRLLRQLPGGSVGLSGPRGIGKTTILRSITDTGKTEIWPGRNLEFYISAPVHYVAFDFVSHLAMEICGRILSPSGLLVTEAARTDPLAERTKAATTRLTGPTTRTVLLRLGTFTLFALFYISVFSALGNSRWRSEIPGIALWSTGGVGLLAFADWLLTKRSVALAAATSELWLPVSAVCTCVGGAIYFRFGAQLWSHREAIGTWASVLLTGTLILALCGSRARIRRRDGQEPAPPPADDRSDSDGTVPLALRAEAEWLLDALSHTRSNMSGTGSKAGSGVSAGFQLSAELSKSYQTTATRRDLTMPELVARLRKLIKIATSYGRVLVAIDELDKIQSEDDARRFINDIKAIFGLGRSYFIIAVSEDAMVSFERRGLAIRTEIDSAFDELVYASYLSFDEIRELLEARVFGLTDPYVQLCYCLSGGLPRDAIRAMRNIVNSGLSTASRILVGEVTGTVLQDEMVRYAIATLSRTDLSAEPWPTELLAALAELRGRNVRPDQYHATADSLPETHGDTSIGRLLGELRLVLRFHAEVFLFFVGDHRSADADVVERLAQTRRDLSQNLAFAERTIEQVRQDRSAEAAADIEG